MSYGFVTYFCWFLASNMLSTCCATKSTLLKLYVSTYVNVCTRIVVPHKLLETLSKHQIENLCGTCYLSSTASTAAPTFIFICLFTIHFRGYSKNIPMSWLENVPAYASCWKLINIECAKKMCHVMSLCVFICRHSKSVMPIISLKF